jgi:hypothetical protein
VLAKVDCRIHFALSYMTVTDPYIRVINHYTVEEDLMNAGVEFCQKHISVDSAKKEVIGGERDERGEYSLFFFFF